MVHCIIVGCSSNSRKDTAIGFFRLPSVVDKEGEEAEELSRERETRKVDFGDKSRRYTMEECAEERKSLWKAF